MRILTSGIALMSVCVQPSQAAPSTYSPLEDPTFRGAVLQQADSMLSRNPNDSRAYATKAAAHLNGGQLDQAIADLTRLVQLNPNDPRWLDMKANAEAIRGDLNAAIADETAAIAIRSSVANFYSNRGTFYLLAGRLKEASADCTRAINMDSRLASAYESLAEVQYRMKNYGIVVEYCNSAILRAPNFPDAYQYRGLAYDLLGNKWQAAQDKAKAKELGFDGTGSIFKDRYK